MSEDAIKTINPGYKKVYRFYDKNTNKALADVITLHNEEIPENNYKIFDPVNPWKEKTLENWNLSINNFHACAKKMLNNKK